MGARHESASRRTWLKRLGWMSGIWLASVLALGAVTFVLRLLMRWAGPTP